MLYRCPLNLDLSRKCAVCGCYIPDMTGHGVSLSPQTAAPLLPKCPTFTRRRPATAAPARPANSCRFMTVQPWQQAAQLIRVHFLTTKRLSSYLLTSCFHYSTLMPAVWPSVPIFWARVETAHTLVPTRRYRVYKRFTVAKILVEYVITLRNPGVSFESQSSGIDMFTLMKICNKRWFLLSSVQLLSFKVVQICSLHSVRILIVLSDS